MSNFQSVLISEGFQICKADSKRHFWQRYLFWAEKDIATRGKERQMGLAGKKGDKGTRGGPEGTRIEKIKEDPVDDIASTIQ